jgi:hypothetical protein
MIATGKVLAMTRVTSLTQRTLTHVAANGQTICANGSDKMQAHSYLRWLLRLLEAEELLGLIEGVRNRDLHDAAIAGNSGLEKAPGSCGQV